MEQLQSKPQQAESNFKRYFFINSALGIVSRSDFFRRAFSILLKVMAVIAVLAGLVVFVPAWKIVFDLPGAAVLGGILFQLFFVVAVYMVVHLLWIRSRDVAKLSDSDYPVVSVVSLILKLVGEVYAAFSVVIGIAGGILIWFAGSYAGYLLKDLSFGPSFGLGLGGGAGFVGGLALMLSGILTGFFMFVLFYLSAELLVVVVEIARDVKKVRSK